ncbi:MAG TPA: carbamate kinase [Candidatus Polarisedimenticolia bacterium]|nr:carbamate kinase [Candidatus Polarisedimenticolia bacterium]
MPRKRLAVVAFGGNALIRKDQEGSQWEQIGNAQETARALLPVIRDGYDLVIVHGNGPQVGNILIQVEEAVTKVPPLSLDVCVAASEGSIGYMLEVALLNELGRQRLKGRGVVTIVTEVVVDQKDPGFRRPTKPIGPFYTRFRSEFLIHKQGWTMVEDAGRGWRKVVPSPRPLEVVQMPAIREAVKAGHVVIAGGGGGIPVYRTKQGDLKGVEAVIDKDYTAGLIAGGLEADLFVILTGVDQVSLNYGRPDQKAIRRMDLATARAHQAEGQFPEGSMGPKVRAAVDFVQATGREVLITSARRLTEAVRGRSGTRIVAAAPEGRAARRRTA